MISKTYTLSESEYARGCSRAVFAAGTDTDAKYELSWSRLGTHTVKITKGDGTVFHGWSEYSPGNGPNPPQLLRVRQIDESPDKRL